MRLFRTFVAFWVLTNFTGCVTLERSLRTSYSAAVNEAVREINNIDSATVRRSVANTVGVICDTCVGHKKHDN